MQEHRPPPLAGPRAQLLRRAQLTEGTSGAIPPEAADVAGGSAAGRASALSGGGIAGALITSLLR